MDRWQEAIEKNNLSMFPKDTEYDRYIEVFGGAGWVLFGREGTKQMEIFNDINSELINLYRCIKYHCDELQRELDWLLMSREQFQSSIKQLSTQGYTDIQRAARYFYIIKTSFGADSRTFATAPRPLSKPTEYLKEIQMRLERVVIENKDFEKLIRVYDRETALFYLDPPYHETEKYYDAVFSDCDHRRLRETLGKIKGKFVLSYNDCEYIRKLYEGYTIREVERSNNLSNTKATFKEVIISNYCND